MSCILLVENGRDSAAVLLNHLLDAGHEVEQLDDGAAALDRILRSSPPALTLLDVVLPRVDGLQVLEKVRSHSEHPIIMLTARAHETDRLRGLDLGADDYICKPFSPREVVARIHTVLRRHAQRSCAGRPSTAVAFEEARGRASLEGHALVLTRRELLLLRALSSAPGRVFSRSKLLEVAFAEALDTSERAIDGHIKNLRKKLTAVAPAHDWIRSIYGVGFTFADRSN